MKHKARNLLALGCILVSSTGCPELQKYNYGPAYDEDPAYLSVPDPGEESTDASDAD